MPSLSSAIIYAVTVPLIIIFESLNAIFSVFVSHHISDTADSSSPVNSMFFLQLKVSLILSHILSKHTSLFEISASDFREYASRITATSLLQQHSLVIRSLALSKKERLSPEAETRGFISSFAICAFDSQTHSSVIPSISSI